MLKLMRLAAALAMVAATASAAGRQDPYKSYRYVLTMDGRPVAGAQRLRGGSGIADYRAGGDAGPSVVKPPGRARFEPITLERGVTHDTGFASWAASASAGKRRSLGLTAFDAAGRPKASYSLSNCWTSKYHALPNRNGNSNAVGIQHIKIRCGGVRSAPRP